MAYYIHIAQTPGTPARAPSYPPRGRMDTRPTGGSDALARLEGSLRAVVSEITSEEANVAHHRQRESDARAELADLRRELDDFRTVARKISDEMFDLRASRQHQYYDRRQCRWCYTPAYERNLREQQDNEESIQAVRGRQREPHQWGQDSRRAINASERKLLTLRARQADYQRQLGNLRTQLRAAEQQAARYPGSQRSASVSIAGSSGVMPPRGTQASLPGARASTRTRSQSSGSVRSKAHSPARQSDASDTYEADAKETIQTERWNLMPPVTFVAAIFGAYGGLFQCSQADYRQAMSWASAAANRHDRVLVHQNWLTLINMLSLVRTFAGNFTASMIEQREANETLPGCGHQIYTPGRDIGHTGTAQERGTAGALQALLASLREDHLAWLQAARIRRDSSAG
jgi:hypothetical protein